MLRSSHPWLDQDAKIRTRFFCVRARQGAPSPMFGDAHHWFIAHGTPQGRPLRVCAAQALEPDPHPCLHAATGQRCLVLDEGCVLALLLIAEIAPRDEEHQIGFP